QKVGTRTVPTEPLANAVDHAQKKIIMGTPENIKQFKDILAQASKDEDGGSITMGGAATDVNALPEPRTYTLGGKTLTYDIKSQLINQGVLKPPSAGLGWNYLQGIYSELGRSMYNNASPIPNDVFNALKYVREQVGGQMRDLAKQAGVE